MNNPTIKTIAIIGAGVAGLGAARLLSQAGFDCEVFEKRDQVGEYGQRDTTPLAYKLRSRCMKSRIIPCLTTIPAFPAAQNFKPILKTMPKTSRFLTKFVLILKLRGLNKIKIKNG